MRGEDGTNGDAAWRCVHGVASLSCQLARLSLAARGRKRNTLQTFPISLAVNISNASWVSHIAKAGGVWLERMRGEIRIA